MQFVAIFTHQFQLFFRECDYPSQFMIWIGLHGVMFLFLFSDFYKTKYRHPQIHPKLNGYSKSSSLNGISSSQSSNKGACMVSFSKTGFNPTYKKTYLLFIRIISVHYVNSTNLLNFINTTYRQP